MPEAEVAHDGNAEGIFDVPLLSLTCSWRATGLDAGWVRVAGELDIATASQLRHTLNEAQQSLRLVVLDLRELTFMDSSGIHVIVDVAAEARRAGGWLLVVRGSGQFDRLFTVTKADRQVLIFDLHACGSGATLRLASPCPKP